MRHAGTILGVIITMVATHAIGAKPPAPVKTKAPISVSANLNPQLNSPLNPSLNPKLKADPNDKAEPEEPSVLEKGSRVVASNTPDEDFVILGRLEPTLPEPKHIETEAEKQTQTNELVEKTLADATPPVTMPNEPPAMLKAPVEVKAGIQHKVSPDAVMVAGPNIGATPKVKLNKVKTRTAAVTIASASPVKEASALKPPPTFDVFLHRPDKVTTVVLDQKPVLAMKQSAKTRAKMPTKKVVKMAAKAPIKMPVRVAVKASKIKHVMAKVDARKVKFIHSKPVVMTAASHAKVKVFPVKTKIMFASYHPPKHTKLIARKAVSMKSVRTAFKPVIKSFKSTSLHVERKSHFHPVIKPYVAS